MSEICYVLSNYRASKFKDPWPNAKRVFWYASQVKQSPTADPELVLILQKFDQEVDQVSRNAIKRTGDKKLSKQADSHWASLPRDTPPSDHQNHFLGLMAEFCVVPYLRAYMLNDLNRTPSKMCISLLENAIFGYEGSLYHIDWEQRIATVAFLLDNGVFRKHIFANGKSAIQKVRVGQKSADSDEKGYLSRVEELLNPKRSLKELLKTRFERVKGR
jgi:hypothetical protein